MPAMPGSGLVVVKTELVLGSLEAILDCPAMALDADKLLNRSPRRAPCGEVGQIAVGNIAPDQQSSRPQTMVFLIELFRLEISQFQVAPVMQPRPFGPPACRQAYPVSRLQGAGNVCSSACNRPR